MLKQAITPERTQRIHFSLQKMAVLSQVLLMENTSEMDVDFRIPFINNFAKRIVSDSKTIQQHLEKSGRMTVKSRDNETLEDYAGEIWRVVDLLIGLDRKLIKEFADHLTKEFNKISA